MQNRKQELLKLIRSTLRQEWDPEYYAYADQVFSRLIQRWEPAKIADYLHQIATEHIGMKATRYQLSLEVANKLSEASQEYLTD